MKRPRSELLSSIQGAPLETIRRSGGKDWAARISLRPVSLCVVELDRKLLQATSYEMPGCLRSGDSVILCGQTHSGKTEFAMHVAVEHIAFAEGSVLWVTAPGCKRFDPARFTQHLETAVLRWHSLDSAREHNHLDDEALAAALQTRVTTYAGGLQVCVCETVEDFMKLLDGSDVAKQWLRRQPAASGTHHHKGATPLLVVDGLGALEYLTLRERHMGSTKWHVALDRFLHTHSCAAILLDSMCPPCATRGGLTAGAVGIRIEALLGNITSSCATYRMLSTSCPPDMRVSRRPGASDMARGAVSPLSTMNLRAVMYVLCQDDVTGHVCSALDSPWRLLAREAYGDGAVGWNPHLPTVDHMRHMLLLFTPSDGRHHNLAKVPLSNVTKSLHYANSCVLFNVDAGGVRFQDTGGPQ